MIVREYRKGDADGIADLWRRNPSEEFPLLGLNPDRVADLLRKFEGLGIRLITGIARLVGRPLIIVLVVDLDGKVCGSTMLSFSRESGYVSGVCVDSAVRRGGYARAMLRTCDTLAQRYHRPYVALEVLSQNVPAIRLYESLGYQTIRDSSWFSCDVGPHAPPAVSPGTTNIRVFRKRDAKPLAELENRQMPERIRTIAPRHPGDFRVPSLQRSMMKAETEAWVVEVDGHAVAFARATVVPIIGAANMSPLLLSDQLSEAAGRDLMATALRWVQGKKAPRVVTFLPDHQAGGRPILEGMGFVEKFVVHTMARPIGS